MNPENWATSIANVPLKKVLAWTAIIMMLAFAYGAIRYVGAYSESIQPGSFRSFGVTGEGKVVAVPDVATFSFGVLTEANSKDIGQLQTENTKKVNRVIESVKKYGVKAEDIKTEQYNLSPRYQYCGGNATVCPPAQIVGYSINQNISVKIRDFKDIGNILSAVVAAGATNVSQLQFSIDDLEKIKNQARAKAIAQAKEQAKAVAKAGGFKLGKLLAVDEFSSEPIYASYDKFGRGGAEMAVSSVALPVPAIEPGSAETIIRMNLRYEIK